MAEKKLGKERINELGMQMEQMAGSGQRSRRAA
jgi:hypothetical protein